MDSPNDLPPPPAKAQLRARLQAGRAALEAQIAALTDAQLVARAEEDAWSVKDHIAHLTAWEAGIAALLRRESRPAAMGVTQEVFEEEGFDTANDVIFAAHADEPLARVLAESHRAHEALLAALDALSDEELRRPYATFETGEAGEPDAPQIWGYIAGNSFGHYEEHLPWIRAAVEALGPG